MDVHYASYFRACEVVVAQDSTYSGRGTHVHRTFIDGKHLGPSNPYAVIEST